MQTCVRTPQYIVKSPPYPLPTNAKKKHQKLPTYANPTDHPSLTKTLRATQLHPPCPTPKTPSPNTAASTASSHHTHRPKHPHRRLSPRNRNCMRAHASASPTTSPHTKRHTTLSSTARWETSGCMAVPSLRCVVQLQVLMIEIHRGMNLRDGGTGRGLLIDGRLRPLVCDVVPRMSAEGEMVRFVGMLLLRRMRRRVV